MDNLEPIQHPLKQWVIGILDFLGPLFHKSEMGVMLIDRNAYVHWSDQGLSELGICHHIEEDPKAKPFYAFDHDDCITCPLAEACRNPIESHAFSALASTENTKEKRSFSMYSHPVVDENNEALYYILFVNEVTDREQAFREKQQLHLMLSNVLDNTADAVITLDMKQAIHSWNNGAWTAFGYTREEVRGEHIGLLIPDNPESQQAFVEIQQLLEDQGFVRNSRTRMRTKEGRTIDVAVTQTVMHDLGDEPFGYSLIIRDISTVVELETNLQAKVDHLQKQLQLDNIIRSAHTLDEVSTTILVAVTAGEGLRFNRAFLLIVDQDHQRLIGMQAVGPSSPEEAHEIYQQHYLEHPTLAEILQDRLKYQNKSDQLVNEQVRKVDIPLSDTEHPFVRCLLENQPYLFMSGNPDEARLHELLEIIPSVQFVCAPMIWQDRPIGIIMADNPVTRQDINMNEIEFLSSFANRAASAISNIQLQENLQAKLEELRNAYQQLSDMQKMTLHQEKLAALGEMASTVAHEIRNPLVSIGGFARLIAKGKLSKENKRYLDIVTAETSRMERILEEVLGYVRRPDHETQLHDVNGLLSEYLTLVRRQVANSDLVVTFDADPACPMIECNDYQLKQAFINIIQNGLDALGRRGQLGITTHYNQHIDEVVIRISDTGIGISEETKANLFKPFFTTKSRGTGLGLSVTKQIITNHNGSINVHSIEGEGSTFEIRLPTSRKKEASHDGNNEEEAAHR